MDCIPTHKYKHSHKCVPLQYLAFCFVFFKNAIAHVFSNLIFVIVEECSEYVILSIDIHILFNK